jgi:hypothetical protein
MTLRMSLALLGLAGWLTTSAIAADDKVEVLARGPVHEAYAEPAEREPKPTPVIPKEPPKPVEELPPDQKPDGANVQWMPGYWAWDEDKKDHIWVSGFWRNAPPNRTWVPGSWRKAEGGYQWSGGFWVDAMGGDKADIDYVPKPPAPLDNEGAATPAPSEDHTYVPGTWLWRDRWVWQPGYYIEHRPGWVWTAPHYRWTPAGYVYIAGYWDYPLDERGILFAPAYIPPAVYAAPSYVYTPTVVVREDCLYGALFVRSGYGSYYFGDYFAPGYASLGFVGWGGHVSASITIGGWYDPLYSYYRCGYRHDSFWAVGIGGLYVGRFNGTYYCPPRTLVQQNVVINNITNNNTNTNVNLNNVTMLSNLNEATRGGRRTLRTVSDADRQAQRDAARSVREVADRRASLESELAGKPGAGGKSAGSRSLKLDVPPKPVASKSQPLPKSAGTSGAGAAPTTKAPPPPKPSVVGKGAPRIGGDAPTPKSPRVPLSKDSPPASPNSNLRPKGGNPPPTSPKLNPSPKGNPTPRSAPKSPASPPIPKSSPSPPRPAPRVSPSIPKSSPAPRPPASIPSVPRTSPPRPAPKKSGGSVSVPPSASMPRPAISRGLSPQPAPRAAAPPARSVPRVTAPPSRPPAARAVVPPARSMPRMTVAPSRPSPAISRPAPSVRRSAPAPARPAAPKRGRR